MKLRFSDYAVIGSLLLLCLVIFDPSGEVNPLEEIRTNVGTKTVKIFGNRGGGTGSFVKAKSGKTFILTNAHICKLQNGNKMLYVQTSGSSKRVPRKVIEIFKQHDLCLVQGFPNIEGLFLAEELSQGENTFTVGHPRLYELHVAVSQFIAPTTVRLFNSNRFGPSLMPVIFFNFANKKKVNGEDLINELRKLLMVPRYRSFPTSQFHGYSRPGSSGSPIVNDQGQIVSVLFAGVQYDNMVTFGVPLNYVKTFLSNY